MCKPLNTYYSLVLLTITAVLTVALIGCSEPPSQVIAPSTILSTEELVDLHIVTGQLVFIPAYSEIFYRDSAQTLKLTTTLAIHNTDLQHEIIVKSVRYYDTDGNLVRDMVNQPVVLHPMATTGFVIEAADTSAGWGANFLVEWGAEQPVYEPVIEAIMVSTQGTEGVSFVSPGRIVSEQVP